ncbi:MULTISPECIES: hypothetical protein [Trichocoleus]|uniref:Uncharacterized protein n=1 Tax=Trichocoleus desertorum GB2-A4 TaxID=2933944 RepID=A0ABV0JG56_9CYAN|nr:hypothetical protein [Trichocoleus sp. FACHB-46]
MHNLNEASEQPDKRQDATPEVFWQTVQEKLKGITPKKLRGGFLVLIGYLLSPLCWWNDLVFNLPVAYFFGYVCGLFSGKLFTPGLIAGYWLSNIIGILLMQLGTADMLQEQPKEQNLKKELLMGIGSSTVYTLVILALVQLKILDVPAIFSDLKSIDLSSLLQLVTLKS